MLICYLPQKLKVCILCSEPGHISWNCPEMFCFNCYAPGHESKHCREPRRNYLNAVCHRCNMYGHEQSVSVSTANMFTLNQLQVFSMIAFFCMWQMAWILDFVNSKVILYLTIDYLLLINSNHLKNTGDQEIEKNTVENKNWLTVSCDEFSKCGRYKLLQLMCQQ